MTDPILLEFIKNDRNIPIFKTCSDSKIYWSRVFQQIEHEVFTPPHRRLSVLRKLFDPIILEKIIEITNNDDDIENDIIDDLNEEHNYYDRERTLTSAERKQSLHIAAVIGKKTDFRKKLITAIDKKRHDNNMYMNYLTLPCEMAQKWRAKPPQNFTGMSLSEKCDAITRRIATDFMHWLKQLGGDEATSMDVPTILDLFEIGCKSHTTDNAKKLPVFTKSIAAFLEMPEYKHISNRLKTKTIAFGRTSLTHHSSNSKPENTAADRKRIKKPPEAIADMSFVFEGIENLRSTKGYSEWLESNPNINPPRCLIRMGLVKEKNSLPKSRSNSTAMIEKLQQ